MGIKGLSHHLPRRGFILSVEDADRLEVSYDEANVVYPAT